MAHRPLPDERAWDRFWARATPRADRGPSWAKTRIRQMVLSQVSTPGHVLDAGCGSGYFSKMFFDLGWTVTALDYAPEALEATRGLTQGQVELLQADLLRDSLQDQLNGRKVSLIFSDGLLEHFTLDDQQTILQNFASVLGDDGLVVSVVPNRYSPWQWIRPWMMPGIEEQPFVLRDLKQCHVRSGFEIVRFGGMNVLPIRFSPEFLGPRFGMLLYVVARKSSVGNTSGVSHHAL